MAEDNELLMVTVSGADRPGILAKLTRVLREHEVEVIDIEQASLQNLLGLHLVLDTSKTDDSPDSLVKDLLFEASRLELNLSFRLVSAGALEALNQRNLWVLTHFGGTQVLAELSEILSEENVNIEMISTASHHGSRSMEMILNVGEAPSLTRVKNRVMAKSRELHTGLGLQKMEAYRKNKRLIFFDVDSTLVDMEVIDEMARRAGVHREVARITEKAMRGDFDFEESLLQRVALLKGMPVPELEEIKERMALSEGVEELITALKWLGYKMGLVTGGFSFFAEHLKARLGFDWAFANTLEIENDALTGRVSGTIIDAAEKARIVSQTACDLGIPLDQTVVVGDGANDFLMLGQAGLAIAYDAKKRLDSVATAALGKTNLKQVLHLLGITEEDISEAMSCRTL
jgi:phosphoserine phosphatase